jgi:protein-S-isoprenylcysteine O-methyltransferase Ste14
LSTERVFRIVFFSLFIALLAIRGVYGLLARRSGLSASFENEQPGGMSPSAFLILLTILALFIFYTFGWPAWMTAPLPGWVRWTGAGMGVLSFPAQLWVHHTLQKRWSAAPGSSNILISEGPYRRVRHPMYAALMLWCLALSLVSAYWPFLILGLVSIPFFHRAAGKEEAAMIERFGGEYRDYMRRTGRFLPRAVAVGRRI